jgi:hypothetical protein
VTVGEEVRPGAVGREPADWLSSATAYFMALGPNHAWDDAAIDDRVRAAVEDGATVLMCFVQDEGYALWPSELVPVAARARGGDVVALLAERSRAAGLRFVAQWMGVHVQTVLAQRHPSWLQRDVRGVAAAAMCLNSPFGGTLLRQVDEVVRRYDVDGVYFDGLYARAGGCFCPFCRLQFRAGYGRDLGGDEGVLRTERAGDHWLDFSVTEEVEDPDLAAFRFATVEGFVRRLRSVLDGARPGVALLLDTLGVQAAHWPNAQRLDRLRDDVDAFVLECYPDQIREPLWHAALETELVRAEVRKPVWLLRWLARDPDGDLVAVPLATVELHAGTAIAHGAPPVAVEMNLHSVDPSLRPVVRRSFGDAAEALEAGDVEAYAAILHPESTRDVVNAQGRGRDLYDPLSGAYLALIEAHLPVSVVTEADVASARLADGLRTILVPGASVLAPGTVAGLEAFVADGGGLVATHRSGFGSDIDATSLAGLLGIRTAGVGARQGRIGTEALGGSELVTYYRTSDSHPSLGAFGDRLLSFSGSYTRVVDHDGADLGAILDSHDAAMDGERWFGWYPGAASSSLGVARERGRGRVVYFAAPLDTVFFQQGRPEAGELIAAAARWTAAGPPNVEVEAPRSVEAVVRRRLDGGLSVALVNRTTNDLYAIGAGIPLGAASSSASGAGGGQRTIRAQHPRYIVPVSGVTIQVRDGAELRGRAQSLRGGDLPTETTASGLTVAVPTLGAYDVITIT